MALWELASNAQSSLNLDTLPQIDMEADRGPYLEDSSVTKGPCPLPC